MSRKIYLTPDELGYKDRGKMKWQGLILSDMTEALKKVNQDDQLKFPQAKEKMSEIELAKILQLAYLDRLPVNIQANVLKDGNFYPDVNCLILGFYDEKIYLQLKDGRQRSCTIEQIRNIEFSDVNEWYEK